MHGLLGRIVKRIEPQTEADPVAILAHLLAYFGNVVGRGPHYTVEANNHHANLFAAIVGGNSKSSQRDKRSVGSIVVVCG